MKITSINDNDINEVIKSKLAQFRQIHLLIDPQIDDSFIYDNELDCQSITVIRDRQDTVSTDNECLQLYTVSHDTIQLDHIINCLNDIKSPIIAVLLTLSSADAIKKQICNAMFMHYQAKPYLLRFYDAKVLKHLLTIWTPKQVDLLLGNIEYWYFKDDKYIELHHSPINIISDLDYKITQRQWHQLIIAQSYNYYEYQIIKQQKQALTPRQEVSLKQILDWGYHSTYYHPDKEILDYLIQYTVIENKTLIQSLGNESFFNIINNKKLNEIKQYFAKLEEGINHGTA